MPVGPSQRNPKGSARERRSAAGVAAQTTKTRDLNLEFKHPGGDLTDGNITFYDTTPTLGSLINDIVVLVTVNNQQTTLIEIPIDPLSGCVIDAQVLSYCEPSLDLFQCNSYHRRGTYTYHSGVLEIVGSLQTIGTDVEDEASLACTMDINDGAVRVRVTGETFRVRWISSIKIVKLQT